MTGIASILIGIFEPIRRLPTPWPFRTLNASVSGMLLVFFSSLYRDRTTWTLSGVAGSLPRTWARATAGAATTSATIHTAIDFTVFVTGVLLRCQPAAVRWRVGRFRAPSTRAPRT